MAESFNPRVSSWENGRSDCCRDCDREFLEYGNGIEYRAEAIEKSEKWWAENAEKVEEWKAEYSLERMLEKLREQGKERQAAIIRATPPWANQRKIAEFYDEAERLTRLTGKPHHVDHMVPLLGPRAKIGPFKGERLVYGFHCEANLRVIPGDENCSKSNRHWPDMVENNGYTPRKISCIPEKSAV
jgi:hypothetical protein